MAENDIFQFTKWATQMGISVEAIPPTEALKEYVGNNSEKNRFKLMNYCVQNKPFISLFKSPQRDVFYKLMRRVRPVDEIKAIKETLLIYRMKKLKNQFLHVPKTFPLPIEMQNNLRKQNLQKDEKNHLDDLNDKRNEFEKLLILIKTKCIEMINTKAKVEKLEAKVILYGRKIKQLDNEIKKEKEIKNSILDTTPVILNKQNNCKSVAEQVVSDAIDKLKILYNYDEKKSDSQTLFEHKLKLWEDMRKTFMNIPNVNLLKVINNVYSTELDKFLRLVANSEHNGLDENLHWTILRKQAELINLIQKYVIVHKKRLAIQYNFERKYDAFQEQLQENLNFINHPLQDVPKHEDLIPDYVLSYMKQNALKHSVDYLKKELNSVKIDSESLAVYLSDHEILLNSIREIYKKISHMVNRMQDGIHQLMHAQEHLIGTRNAIKKKFLQKNVLDGNRTVNAIQHSKEMKIFTEIKMDQCAIIPSEWLISFTVNPLIIGCDELTLTLLLAPNIPLTPNSILQKVCKDIVWSEYIKGQVMQEKVHINLDAIDIVILEQMMKESNDCMKKFSNRIEYVLNKTDLFLKENERLYKFILTNPLRHYIPNDRKFKNRCYKDYECEFMVHYRMLSSDACLAAKEINEH